MPYHAILSTWQRISQKFRNAAVEIRYLLGDSTPAQQFLMEFRRTATHQPVLGHLGELRGYSSLTTIADFDISCYDSVDRMVSIPLVVKFETRPGKISAQRFIAEQRNECLARKYLDKFMPRTLRVIGHGLRNESSALVYQGRVRGKPLRCTSWTEIVSNPQLCTNLVEFCDRVLQMSQQTGQVPDLSGTLPRVDHLSNLFWRSRNILVNTTSGAVWLVDTGWKPQEESLRNGPLRSRLRTWFRIQSMRFFKWRLTRALATGNAWKKNNKS